MDKNISLFLEKLNALIPLSEASEEALTENEIRRHFEGIELSDEHFARIYDYLQANQIDVEREKEEELYKSLDLNDLTVPEGTSEDDPVLLYIKEIKEIKIADDVEKTKMLDLLKYDPQTGCDQIVKAYQRCVYALAKRNSLRGVLIMDLVQEGNIGLFTAISEFEGGVNEMDAFFCTKISDAMEEVIAQYARENKAPEHIADTMNKIRTIQEIMEETSEEEPDIADIAKELDIPLERVQEILRLSKEED